MAAAPVDAAMPLFWSSNEAIWPSIQGKQDRLAQSSGRHPICSCYIRSKFLNASVRVFAIFKLNIAGSVEPFEVINMPILALLHRILDHCSRRSEPISADEEAGLPDIEIVSLPPSPATRALAKALQASHGSDGKS
ncbi:hypothetical protein [Labrys neptuniae]